LKAATISVYGLPSISLQGMVLLIQSQGLKNICQKTFAPVQVK